MNTKNSHRWPLWWRLCILFNISLYSLLGNAFAAGVTPLFGLLFADLHCTVAQASHLTTFALLTLGLSNVLALPGSALLSKRYLILLSQVVFLACNIWAARASSYNSLLGTRIVGGLAAGVVEALGPTFVVETFQERQLSRAMVVYTAFLALGGGVGPLFAGIIAFHLKGWRSFFWIMAIVTGVNLIGCFIMLPETSDQYGLEYAPDAWRDTQQEPQDDKSLEAENIATAQETELANEDFTDRPSWYRVWRENSFYVPVPNINPRGFLRGIWKSMVLISMPPVTLAVLIYGMSIGWSVVVSILTAAVFQSPPYLWSPEAMGTYGICSIVGVVIGVPFGGILPDYLSRLSAKRNNGLHKAESRLPAMIIPFLVSPLGVLIVGIYLSRGEIWIREAVGTAMLGFGTTAAASTMLSYAIDSFPHRSSEIGFLVNIVKNILGFGISYGAVQWWQEEGFLDQFGTMAALLWAIYLFLVPLYFYGANIRTWALEKVKV